MIQKIKNAFSHNLTKETHQFLKILNNAKQYVLLFSRVSFLNN